jgi:hypothetical protein
MEEDNNYLEMDGEEIDSDDNDDDGDDNESSEGVDIVEVEDENNVEEFLRTFHNGDYDAEFDNALSLDRAVPSRVGPTQAAYNKPDNWLERNRIGLARVKKQLQTCIDLVMHNGNLQLNLTHNDGWGHLRDNEEPIVWHESILDRYWDQLEAKIGRNQLDIVTTDINCIYSENIEIKKERLAALVAMLQNGRATISCTDVKLINTNLCEEGIVSLSKLVDVSYELQYFYLHHNRIDNMDSARCLSRSIKSHNQLNHLSLKHCKLGGNPEILLVILQSDISFINLQNNNIDSLGAAKIAEYLKGNPPIQRIDLEKNRLNDDDAILISQALKRNTNLKIIHLKGNNFTSIGVKALLNCVFDSSSLNAISESNHTLLSMFIFSMLSNIRLHGCIDIMLDLDRTQKIILALQDKDSLLKYLANVPVELIPEVLEFTRWADDQPLNKHLNIFYSTMRWWNMPLLYSYYNCVKSDAKRKREMTD